MNKKLFSWKALAGLALLVAVGLTSCKQGTEVDPNDPYNTKTPTQPGISIKGSADVTITVIASGDLAAQWAKLDSKTVEKLREQSTLNVLVKSGSYKLDGGVLQLPNFFAGAKATTGKVVNVQYTISCSVEELRKLKCSTIQLIRTRVDNDVQSGLLHQLGFLGCIVRCPQ